MKIEKINSTCKFDGLQYCFFIKILIYVHQVDNPVSVMYIGVIFVIWVKSH